MKEVTKIIGDSLLLVLTNYLKKMDLQFCIETTVGFSSSMYLFYIASKKPEIWKSHFPKLKSLNEFITSKNDGTNFTLFSKYILHFDNYFRRFIKLIKNK